MAGREEYFLRRTVGLKFAAAAAALGPTHRTALVDEHRRGKNTSLRRARAISPYVSLNHGVLIYFSIEIFRQVGERIFLFFVFLLPVTHDVCYTCQAEFCNFYFLF